MYVTRLLAVGLALCLAADARAAAPLDAEHIGAFFDIAMTAEMRDHRVVGGVLAVVKDGDVLLTRGYGWANLERREHADPRRSLFRIGSISKPFVWTAVMQLVEQGRLDLDADVNTYLDTFRIPDTFDEPVRMRHLLSHTAGFEDRAIGTSAISLSRRKPLAQYLEEQMPARVRPPGTQVAYSNWGTSLAAYIVARISGEQWSDYVDRHILMPLHMRSTNTHTEPRPELAERLATSYSWQRGELQPREYDYLNDEPAGAISTTADDMTRFMLAHLGLGAWRGNRILSEATARRMRTPLFAPHPGIAPMLHGFYRSDRNGQLIFGHGGDANQFHSQLAFFPEHDLGVFVSFNADSADPVRTHLMQAFADHFFPVAHLPPPPPPADRPLDDYTGEYLPLRSNHSTIERLGTLVTGIRITAEDGELLLHTGTTSRWRPETATANDRFVARYDERLMVFERQDGRVTHLLIDTPLNTFRRVDGLQAPGVQRRLLAAMAVLALATVLGYGWRGLQRAVPQARLPLHHVLLAWLHAVLLLGLYGYLAWVLGGNVEAFVFGVPPMAHLALLLHAGNALLGVLVVFAAISQWRGGRGAATARLRYSLFALAALANLWFAWYFNILVYPLHPELAAS